MGLTSTSSYSDALNQYHDNLVYEGDATKTTAYLEAVRWIIAERAQTTSSDQGSQTFEPWEERESKASAHLLSLQASSRNRDYWARGRCIR